MMGERIIISGQDPNRANKRNALYDPEERRKALAAHIIRAGLEGHVDSTRLVLGATEEPPVSSEPKEVLDDNTEPPIRKTIFRTE